MIRKLIAILSSKERKKIFLVFIAIFASALFDVLGIASLAPFMGVVSNPSMVQNNAWLRWAFEAFEFTSVNNFLIFLGLSVLFLIIIANLTRLLTLWFITSFEQNCKAELATRLLSCYLRQPYEYFLLRNTSDLSKNVVEEVNRVVHNVLHHLLEICARAFLALSIFSLLLYINPILAVSAIVVLGGAYAVIYFLVRRKLDVIGQKRILANQGRFQVVNETLGGIKDLKVLGREETFLARFSDFAQRLAKTESYHTIVSQAPKNALETLAFGGILLIVLYFLITKTGTDQVVPLLALYAFAGYRLMPALQVVFLGVSTIRFNLAALDLLHEEMRGQVGFLKQGSERAAPLPLRQCLELEDIVFAYQNTESPVLKKFNLKIEANTIVGFAGTTGAGKTTLIDTLLGLLVPQHGVLKVDGSEVRNGLILRWQRNIGYVPQFIYLADASVVDNIAFGVPHAEIDREAVEHAAKIAQLHEFVEQELPQGYETMIGERGVRLSGGQRQRIGIARALYHDPQVLILDEATSALDNTTEKLVMKTINTLCGKKTIIIIAHRVTTLQDCDVIYLLERGRIVASGSFEELMQNNELFMSAASDFQHEAHAKMNP